MQKQGWCACHSCTQERVKRKRRTRPTGKWFDATVFALFIVFGIAQFV